MNVAAVEFGFLFGSVVVIEDIFRLPGVGSLVLVGIINRDYPVLLAGALTITLFVLVVNLVVDIGGRVSRSAARQGKQGMIAAVTDFDWHRWRLVIVGGVIIGAILIGALFASLIAPYSPFDLDVAAMLQGPSAAHWLGTDELGRDVLSRTIYAAQISMQVAFIAAGVGLVFGTLIGVVAAYFGGWVDLVLMRFMELLFSFPAILLAVVLMASLGTSIFNAMIAIGIVFIPGFSRLARAATEVVLREQYVEAARAVGHEPWAHPLPRDPAQHPRAAAGRGGGRLLLRDPAGIGAVVPRARRAAAGPVLGQHAEHRARLHVAGAVAQHRAGHGDLPDRARLQLCSATGCATSSIRI